MKKLINLNLFLVFLLAIVIIPFAHAQVGIGTTTPTAQLTVTESAIFNESGTDNDFRVESLNRVNMILVNASDDAIGFNTATPFNFSIVSVVTDFDNYGIYSISSGTNGVALVGDADDDGTGILGLSYFFDGTTVNYGLGTGVAGSSDISDGFYSVLVDGSGLAGEGFSTGVYGIASDITDSAFGGYFVNDGSYAYVGGWENDLFFGWTDYKVLGSGTVSTIVQGTDGSLITMACPESPEVLFQDYGVGKLINGVAHITIDVNFSKNILVDEDHPLKVFIQLEGDCKGVYVTNKSQNGFDVKELQSGNSNVNFSWSITATRANEDRILEDGSIKTADFSWRFRPAPSKKEQTFKNIKKENMSKSSNYNRPGN